MARIIDYGIKERNQAYVFQQVGLLALCWLAQGSRGQHYCPVVCRQGQRGPGQPATAGSFDKVESSVCQPGWLPPSTLICLTSDINQVQTGFNMALRLLLRSPFIVFWVIAAFTVNVKAALIFAVAIPLLALVVFGIMLVSIPLPECAEVAG